MNTSTCSNCGYQWQSSKGKSFLTAQLKWLMHAISFHLTAPNLPTGNVKNLRDLLGVAYSMALNTRQDPAKR